MQDSGSVFLFLAQYWPLVISLVIGSSGLVGWLLTYLQLRQQRRLEATRLFRELVLTPEMLQLYGSDFDLLDLYEAEIELRQGKQPIVKLPETKGRLVTITSEDQLLALTLKVFARIDDLMDKVSRSALTLLLPMRLRKKEGDFVRTLRSAKSLDNIEKARSQFFEFGNELKKILGLDVLEGKNLTASRHSMSKSEDTVVASMNEKRVVSNNKAPDRHRAVLEASVLLVTLVFLVIQVWSSRNTAAMSADEIRFYSLLVQMSFAVGFLFTLAAGTFTLLIFGMVRDEFVEGFETVGVLFFLVGLLVLAGLFFVNSVSAYYALFVVVFAVSVLVLVVEHRKVKPVLERIGKKIGLG